MTNQTKKQAEILKKNFSQNKKGISGVVTVVILIALVVALVSIVWVAVQSLVEDKLSNAKSCMGIFEKVKINNRYTCFNKSVPTEENTTQFSISIGDIDVDEVWVSIGEGTTKTYKTYKIPETYSDVKNYGTGTYGDKLILPEKNAGLTYVSKGWPNKPDSIQITPVINGVPCEPSDSLSKIDYC